MRSLFTSILILPFLWGCGSSSQIAKYEPPMDVVIQEAHTVTAMLTNGDFNQDGRLNWWEALVILNNWIARLQQLEAPESEGAR